MAHKKAGGSSRNGRDTAGKRLGVKKYGGEHVIPGNIIIRQRGTQWHPGTGVGMGVDHTIYADSIGQVEFRKRSNERIYVSVVGTDGTSRKGTGHGSGLTARGKAGSKVAINGGRAVVGAKAAGAGKASATGAKPGSSAGKGATGTMASGKGRAFALLSAPEGGKSDELGLIGGVAEKTEQLMHAHGIFHFWQVAAMSEADIANLEGELRFPGRIKREEWQEQARELMAGKPSRAKVDRERDAGKH